MLDQQSRNQIHLRPRTRVARFEWQQRVLLTAACLTLSVAAALTAFILSLAFAPPVIGAESAAPAAQLAPTRPLGVWMLAIANAVLAGLLPLTRVLIYFRTGGWNRHPKLRGGMLLYGLLGIGVLATALGVWMGIDRARVTLLILIGISYGLSILSNLALLPRPREQRPAFSFPIVGLTYAAGWLSVNLWYFLHPEVAAWYVA